MNVTFITIIKPEQDDGKYTTFKLSDFNTHPIPNFLNVRNIQDNSYLIKGDLFIVPVLNVEEQHYMAMFVSAREDPWVSGFNCAAYSFWA